MDVLSLAVDVYLLLVLHVSDIANFKASPSPLHRHGHLLSESEIIVVYVHLLLVLHTGKGEFRVLAVGTALSLPVLNPTIGTLSDLPLLPSPLTP